MKNIKLFALTFLLAILFFACKKDEKVEDLSIYVTPSVATVTTSAASNISAFAARVSGTITTDGNSTLTACGIAFGEAASPTIEGFHTVCDTLKGSFIGKVGGLKLLTKYYARAYALNREGISYGNEITFTTTNVPDYSPFIGTATETSGITGGGTNAVTITKGTADNTLVIAYPVAAAMKKAGWGTEYTGPHAITITINPVTNAITGATQPWMDSYVDPTEMGPMTLAVGSGTISFATNVISIKWTIDGNDYWGGAYTPGTAFTYKKN
jgi:hypothetical protein